MRAVPALLAASLALAAAPAFAQGVMTPGAMPLPPSARDAPPPKESEAAKKKPAPRRKATQSEAAPKPAAAAAPSYRERIDTRRGSGALELEDDPRSVQPIMQNGRAGMGMRF